MMDWKLTTTKGKPRQALTTFKLCTRCQRIDFEAIFNQQKPIPPKNGRPVFALGQLKPDSVCPACRLFDAVAVKPLFDRKRRHQHYHLRVFWASQVLGSRVSAPTENQDDVALAVCPGKALVRDVYPYMRIALRKRGFLLPRFMGQVRRRTQAPSSLLEGSHVDPIRIDYARLKGWLHECDEFHDGACKPKASISSLRVPLRCIDCFTRTIVEITPDDEYVALSYVWGTPPAEVVEDAETGRLPEDASQVVEDAIVVVRELGKRYLWVDKYCINQGNHSIKDVQIRDMDLIYSCAHATIIAGAGSDASFGLPGVSTPRITYPSVVYRRKFEILPTRPSLPYAIAHTTWIKRGWTYQEVTLSRRCLFFTTHQVYFVCPIMDCCEAVNYREEPAIRSKKQEAPCRSNNLQADIPIEARRFLPLDTPRYNPSEASHLQKYAEHVTEYTSRTLTYDSDILDAFRGLLSRSPFPTYYGIPLAASTDPSGPALGTVKSLNMGFARGLFWTPKHQFGTGTRISISRRPGFPSWSWAGWKGSVDYCSEGGPREGDRVISMTPDMGRFDTTFLVEHAEGQFSDFQKLALSQSTIIIPELSHRLVIEARVFRFRFQAHATYWNEYDVCVCYCHIGSSHGGGVVHDEDVWDSPIFCDQPREANDLYRRMTSETWDCVLLFESTEGLRNLLIIDWVEDVAYRVGVLQLRDGGNKLDSLPSSRRRIPLA